MNPLLAYPKRTLSVVFILILLLLLRRNPATPFVDVGEDGPISKGDNIASTTPGGQANPGDLDDDVLDNAGDDNGQGDETIKGTTNKLVDDKDDEDEVDDKPPTNKVPNKVTENSTPAANECPKGRMPATIVSAFYRLPKSKHSMEDYRSWLTNFLSKIEGPVVFYTNEESVPMIKELRGDRLITLNLTYKVSNLSISPSASHHTLESVKSQSLTSHTHIIERDQSPFEVDVNKGKEEFWEKQTNIDPEKSIHGPALYASWNAKVISRPFLKFKHSSHLISASIYSRLQTPTSYDELIFYSFISGESSEGCDKFKSIL